MSETGRDQGTTLIEALAVVAITALVALVGFPRLQQSLDGFAERATTAAAAARLRQTHADAMRLGMTRLFEVTADGRGYAASGWAYAPAAGRARLFSPAAIAFHADGSSSGGSVIVADGGLRERIDVAPTTGAVDERAP